MAIWSSYKEAKAKDDLEERKRVDTLRTELETHLAEATRSARSLATADGMRRKGKRAKPDTQQGDKAACKTPEKSGEDNGPKPKKLTWMHRGLDGSMLENIVQKC